MSRIDPLENRRLFATVVTLPDGLIRITGTSGDDTIDVSLLGRDRFRISDGTTNTDFRKRDVNRISFIGGAGDDFITLGRVPARAYMEGGLGKDSLSASNGDLDDTLVGDDGNDYLYAGPGDDTLNGGNGGDFQIGSDGVDYLETKSEISTDDTVSGGRGNDTVSLQKYPGGTTTTIGLRNPGLQVIITDTCYGDIENLIGSNFDDRVYDRSYLPITYRMGDGDDAVYAGNGQDTIYGEAGKDSISAGDGDDVIYVNGDSAIDSVVGGEGDDRAVVDGNDLVKTVENATMVARRSTIARL
ncbi:MAG TPA: hypothetical protein VF595_09665 [Tepidisphaeraceae bacterium]|jgi:Ca2+-binding RTX toxin-like protein